MDVHSVVLTDYVSNAQLSMHSQAVIVFLAKGTVKLAMQAP